MVVQQSTLRNNHICYSKLVNAQNITEKHNNLNPFQRSWGKSEIGRLSPYTKNPYFGVFFQPTQKKGVFQK